VSLPVLTVGMRVEVPVPRGAQGVVVKPTVTRRGWGATLFTEVKLDNGTIVWPRRVYVKVIP